MVCCQVSGEPQDPVADPVASGAIGFTVVSRTMVVVPARWKPKASPAGTVPSVTPVMSTLPAPVTMLKLVFGFGVPVMFTVPLSAPLPPVRLMALLTRPPFAIQPCGNLARKLARTALAS